MKLDTLLSLITDSVKVKFPFINVKSINKDDIIFEERVKMNCFYCARYGVSWKCPPHIPNIDYKKVISEYSNAAFVWLDLPFTKSNYSDIRNDSSVFLHKALLFMEDLLFAQNNSMCLSFIGGSCKLCKTGCGKDRCNNPYQARTPLEATGVNVVKSAEKYDIKIKFPVTDHLMRIGLLLW